MQGVVSSSQLLTVEPSQDEMQVVAVCSRVTDDEEPGLLRNRTGWQDESLNCCETAPVGRTRSEVLRNRTGWQDEMQVVTVCSRVTDDEEPLLVTGEDDGLPPDPYPEPLS